MSTRTEFHPTSVTSSAQDPVSQDDTRFYTTFRKVALILPILLVGGGFMYHFLTKHSEKPINPIDQDPTLFDTMHCKQLRDVWESVRPLMGKNPQCSDQRTIRFDDLLPTIEKYAHHCKVNITSLENEIPDCPERPAVAEDLYRAATQFDILLNFARNPNLYNLQCGNLDKNDLHKKEIKAIEAINSDRFFTTSFEKTSQEYLRLRFDDPRPKSLFLSTDHTSVFRALDPSVYTDVLRDLNQKTDFKYKAINSYKEACHEIYSASSIGKISDIYIQAEKSQLLNWEKFIIVSEVTDANNPLSECYHESYTGNKPRPVWLD